MIKNSLKKVRLSIKKKTCEFNFQINFSFPYTWNRLKINNITKRIITKSNIVKLINEAKVIDWGDLKDMSDPEDA